MKQILIITTVLTSLLTGAISGCQSLSSPKSGDIGAQDESGSYEMGSEEGAFSKIRPRDPDSEAMGLSSKSREIERNLGI